MMMMIIFTPGDMKSIGDCLVVNIGFLTNEIAKNSLISVKRRERAKHSLIQREKGRESERARDLLNCKRLNLIAYTKAY